MLSTRVRVDPDFGRVTSSERTSPRGADWEGATWRIAPGGMPPVEAAPYEHERLSVCPTATPVLATIPTQSA